MKNPCRNWRHLLEAVTTLSMLAIAGTAAGLLGWLFYALDSPIGVTVVKNFLLHINGKHHLTVFSPVTSLPAIKGTLGTMLQSDLLNLRSSNEVYAHATALDIDLKISLDFKDDIQIYTIQWHYQGMDQSFQDCFSLEEAIWFATLPEFEDCWPLGNININHTLLLPAFGGSQRFWLSSNGVGLILPSDSAVIYSFNFSRSQRICFQGYNTTEDLKVKYKIIVGVDIKHVHAYISSLSPKPSKVPPKMLFTKPTWSVQSLHEESLQLETYTKKIISHNFNGSLLLFKHDYIQTDMEKFYLYSKKHREKDANEINSKWLTKLSEELGYIKRRGLCPTVVISITMSIDGLHIKPYIRVSDILETKAYKIRHSDSDRKYFHALIRTIHEIEVCNVALDVKIDGDLKGVLTFDQGMISRNWHFIHGIVNQTLDKFSWTLVSRTGASPWMNNFVQMEDRSPDWNSLGSVLPEAFSLSIAGYPFLMAPGLALLSANTSHLHPLLDAELYIRWMQLVALFPAVHINIPPWFHSPNVTQIVHEVLNIRQKYLPSTLKAAQLSVHSGMPIIRPIWMMESTTDPEVIAIHDQFSISHSIVVAPVLTKNCKSRSIYLPSGRWMDTVHAKTITGPKWIKDFNVDMTSIPIFDRINVEDE